MRRYETKLSKILTTEEMKCIDPNGSRQFEVAVMEPGDTGYADMELTEALRDKVNGVLDGWGWYSTGWGGYVFDKDWSPNPHGLEGKADPIHY